MKSNAFSITINTLNLSKLYKGTAHKKNAPIKSVIEESFSMSHWI